MVLNRVNASRSAISTVLLAVSFAVLLPTGATSSPEKQTRFRLGLVALSAIEVAWDRTKKYESAMKNAHDIRQQINDLVKSHSSACIYEAPAGNYDLVCSTCLSLPKSTLEKLNRLEGQEGIDLKAAKAIRFSAISAAAEGVRKRENLDVIVDKEAGIIAGFANLIAPKMNRNGAAVLRCGDYTDEVVREIKH